MKQGKTLTWLSVIGMTLLLSSACGQKNLKFAGGMELDNGNRKASTFEEASISEDASNPEDTVDRSNPFSHSYAYNPVTGQWEIQPENQASGNSGAGAMYPGGPMDSPTAFLGKDHSQPTGDSPSHKSFDQQETQTIGGLQFYGPGGSEGGRDGAREETSQKMNLEGETGNASYSAHPEWKSGPLAGLQEFDPELTYPREGNQGLLQEEYISDGFPLNVPFRQNENQTWGAGKGNYQDFAYGEGTGENGVHPYYPGGGYLDPYQSNPNGSIYKDGQTQVELQDVFFEYDSWRITNDGTQALTHDAEWLRQNDERSLTVEGHCDQRGTQNYNLVLGKKRAEAVRTYLIDLGVAPNQVNVISFGKERPFCMGHSERCMQLNRRGHLALHRQ